MALGDHSIERLMRATVVVTCSAPNPSKPKAKVGTAITIGITPSENPQGGTWEVSTTFLELKAFQAEIVKYNKPEFTVCPLPLRRRIAW